MEAHAGHGHLRRLGRGIECGKDQIQTPRVLRLHLASVPALKERREALVLERLDHDAECNLIGAAHAT